MTDFSITIEIQALPERVWAVMRDVERWHEWTPTVKSIKRFGAGKLGVGSRLLIRQPKLPPAVWKIIELEEGKYFISVTGSPIVRVMARHSVEEKNSGTKVTLSIKFSGLFGSLAALMTRSLNERYLALEANGLKERSESTIAHE